MRLFADIATYMRGLRNPDGWGRCSAPVGYCLGSLYSRHGKERVAGILERYHAACDRRRQARDDAYAKRWVENYLKKWT